MVLVGNKCDLEYSRVILKSDAEQLAKRLNDVEFLECSAKTRYNVELIFNLLIKQMNAFYPGTKIIKKRCVLL